MYTNQYRRNRRLKRHETWWKVDGEDSISTGEPKIECLWAAEIPSAKENRRFNPIFLRTLQTTLTYTTSHGNQPNNVLGNLSRQLKKSND